MISDREIKETLKRIEPSIYRTPLVYNNILSEKLNCDIYFKTEIFQKTGSFKLRGALSKILTLTDEEKRRGIITASSGNHAQGVAYAASVVGAKAVIVMPENARQIKVKAVKALGAEVIQFGTTPLERYEKVYSLMEEKGYTLVHSCNDPHVITGQGTIGLEIAEEMRDIDSVIVPLGAGALLGGVACAVKSIIPDARLIGVEPANVPRFTESRKNGKAVDVEGKGSVADGLCMSKTFPEIFELIESYVDDIVTVSEESIKQATYEMLATGKMLVEPSGSIGLAGVISGKIKLAENRKHVIILTGGNITAESMCDTFVKSIE